MNRMRESAEEKPKAKKAAKPMRLPRGFISVLNGSFLTKDNVLLNMPFILFLAGAGLLSIAYGYHAERVVRDIDEHGAALKEQRAEYISVRAELEKQEQQSQVAGRISALGLKESRVPPVKLEVDEDKLDDTRIP
ncbi:MAG: hypothetical protein IPK70_17025 [Flavobacteriales bacterium]|nr:hypothetical protein [Flavobacteriales bacterium]